MCEPPGLGTLFDTYRTSVHPPKPEYFSQSRLTVKTKIDFLVVAASSQAVKSGEQFSSRPSASSESGLPGRHHAGTRVATTGLPQTSVAVSATRRSLAS